MNTLIELLGQLPLLVEHTAIAVAAIGGVLAARGKQIDLFGVLVLALVTAFGGGTVRDLMIGDLPVAWLRANLLPESHRPPGCKFYSAGSVTPAPTASSKVVACS